MRLENVPRKATSWSPIVFFLVGLLLSAGCDGPRSQDAVARNSKFDPVYGEIESQEVGNSGVASGVAAEGLSFLHNDHCGCVCLRPQNILSRPDLREIPWADLELRLAELVGSENSQLSSINSIWLLFDRSYLERLTSGTSSSGLPFVTVIDYSNRVDDASLNKAADEFFKSMNQVEKNNAVSDRSQKGSFRIEKLSDKRIVIGDADAITKLNSDSDAREIRDIIKEYWDETADADIAVVIEPIRPVLLGLFEMISRFGGEGQKLAQIPDVIENIRLQVSLKPVESGNDIIMLGSVKIEDDQLAAELVKTINSLSSVSESLALATGMNGGPGESDLQENLMFVPSSAKSLSQLITEINEKKLFSVRNPPGEIAFQLGRPQALRNVILAAVEDGKKQMEVMNRVERLTKIGDAIKSYENKYDCLPSRSAISAAESKQLGVPAQFSWRVALLPFLGLQELYDRFDFSKPWNAAENQIIAQEIPALFKGTAGDQTSAFQLAAGQETVYRSDRNRPKLSDFSDRKIWTAIVIESHQDSEQDWTQPDGPEFDVANLDKIGKQGEFGIIFVNASFQVRILKKDNERLRKILSSDGNESLSNKDFIRLK